MLPDIAQGQDGRVSEQLCASAAAMANALDASAIFVYTRRGYMANFVHLEPLTVVVKAMKRDFLLVPLFP